MQVNNQPVEQQRFIPQMEPCFDGEESKVCKEYMETGGWLMEFNRTRELEQMIAKFVDCKYCHMISNGTISLVIALLAMDIKNGDKVIVPNMTMIATPNAVKLIGAIPVLVDIEPDTLNIDISIVEQMIAKDKSIKCVIHVSMNTRCNNIEYLRKICDENKVYLLEDSAQSLGSYHNNKHLGTFGHIGSFSFSTPKIITTGQGGALITDDEKLSAKIQKLKNFGRSTGFMDIHDSFGINCKFTDIQAVIGIEQMKKMEQRISRKKEIWNLYYDRLSNNDNIHMIKSNDSKWIPWFIDIYVDNPVVLAEFLKLKKIGSRLVYPPIHSQKVYSEYNKLAFPVTENFSKHGLWLPSSIRLSNNEINLICDCILEYYNTSKINMKTVLYTFDKKKEVILDYPVNFRLLKLKDQQEYMNLITQFRPITNIITKEMFECIYNTIFNSGGILLAIDNNTDKIIGSLTYIIEQKFIFNCAKYCHIEDVIVDGKYRHKGIGIKLMNKMKEMAKSQGCYKITLVCSPNIREFYINCGLEQRGIQMSNLL